MPDTRGNHARACRPVLPAPALLPQTLNPQVGAMVTGLRGLRSRLLEVREYLQAVLDGRLPVNHDIMRNLQVRAPPLAGRPGHGLAAAGA